MELFGATNFDFLGKKWPFIIASLVLTTAGLVSLGLRGGPRYGIDFKGGAMMYLRFNQEPPVQKIRSALEGKVKGEISVKQITGRPATCASRCSWRTCAGSRNCASSISTHASGFAVAVK